MRVQFASDGLEAFDRLAIEEVGAAFGANLRLDFETHHVSATCHEMFNASKGRRATARGTVFRELLHGFFLTR